MIRPGDRVVDNTTFSRGTVRLAAMMGGDIILIVDMDDCRVMQYYPQDLVVV